MLDSQNIKAVIQSGEGYNAEFKVALPKKLKDISSEICAFANSAGGILILGVDDNNNIIGCHLTNFQRSSLQNSINEINPHIHCELYSVVLDTIEIWVVEVHTGEQKPYVLSGVIYVRQGSNTQKLISVEEMRDFFQQSSKIYFDEAACEKFDSHFDIDEEYFEEFKILSGLSPAISQAQIIENLQLKTSDGKLKNGAVLFFGRTPEFFIDKAVIRCVAFDGKTKVDIIDDKVYGGPLMSQYKNTMQWLKGKLNVKYIIEDGSPRKEVWEIPEVALKESLINALSHRDYYDKGGRITVELFDNRLEISNPGGLVKAITPQEFGSKSHSRNPLIFGLFERINMVEQIGSGVTRIKDALKSVNANAATYKFDGIFTIIFNRIPDAKLGNKLGDKLGDKLGNNALNIFIEIEKNAKVTIAQISKSLGIASSTVENNIRKLKNEQIIKREGSDRKGFYVSIKPQSWVDKWGDKWGDNLTKIEQQILNILAQYSQITILEISQKLKTSTTTIENNIKKLKQKKLLTRIGTTRKGYWKIL